MGTPASLHSAAKRHPKAQNSLSPYRPPKSPQPAYTVRLNATPRHKIPYLPTDHPNHPSPPITVRLTATPRHKIPYLPPMYQFINVSTFSAFGSCRSSPP